MTLQCNEWRCNEWRCNECLSRVAHTSKPNPLQLRSITAKVPMFWSWRVNVQYQKPGFSTAANCLALHMPETYFIPWNCWWRTFRIACGWGQSHKLCLFGSQFTLLLSRFTRSQLIGEKVQNRLMTETKRLQKERCSPVPQIAVIHSSPKVPSPMGWTNHLQDDSKPYFQYYKTTSQLHASHSFKDVMH